MGKFIVMSSHSVEDCQKARKYFKEYHAGFLTHFEWGCYDNDHTAYAFVDAKNHDHARLAVPPLFRNKTRVVKLTTFDPKQTSDPAHE